MQWYVFLNVHSARILFLFAVRTAALFMLLVDCTLSIENPDYDPVVLSKFDNSRYIVWTSRSVAT